MNWYEVLSCNEQLVFVCVVHYTKGGKTLYHSPGVSNPDPQGTVSDALEAVREELGGKPVKAELYVGGNDQKHVFDGNGFYSHDELASLSPHNAADEAAKIANIDPFAMGQMSADTYYFLSAGDVHFGSDPSLGMHKVGFRIARIDYCMERERAERFALGWRDRMETLVNGSRDDIEAIYRNAPTVRCGVAS